MKMTNIAEFIEVLTLQKANLTTYLAAVSCTAADVTAVTNRLNNINALITYCAQLDAAKQQAFELKDLLVWGETGLPIPALVAVPAAPVLTAPASGGMKDQRKLNARIKAGPSYTDPIGDALGVGPGEVAVPIPQPPTVDVFAAEAGMVFSVVVSGRTGSDQWELLVRPVGGGAWTSMGSRTTKSGDFTYNPGPTAGDNPVQLEVRVQLKKNDANYGPPSAIHQVTVNP